MAKLKLSCLQSNRVLGCDIRSSVVLQNIHYNTRQPFPTVSYSRCVATSQQSTVHQSRAGLSIRHTRHCAWGLQKSLGLQNLSKSIYTLLYYYIGNESFQRFDAHKGRGTTTQLIQPCIKVGRNE